MNLRRALLLAGIASSGWAQLTEPERLIEAGHWKRARAIVEVRIREAPDDPLANFLLSQIRNAFGDRNSPLALAEKASALDPKTAKYHRQIAECLGVMAQHSGAFRQLLLARRFRREIDTALALDPRDTQALRDLTEFYLLAPGLLGGDLQKAGEVANRIGKIDATEGFLAQARIAEVSKQPGEVEAWLRRAVEAGPSNYRTRMVLAEFYLAPAHANPAAAAAQAKAAIELDPGRSAAYSVLAQIYAASGDWGALTEVLAAAQRQVPDDPSPYYRAAERLALSGGDVTRAARYLRVYLAQDPEGNGPTTAEAHALQRRWMVGQVSGSAK